jgi:hypothetical protein
MINACGVHVGSGVFSEEFKSTSYWYIQLISYGSMLMAYKYK